jgi:hypothetical protein
MEYKLGDKMAKKYKNSGVLNTNLYKKTDVQPSYKGSGNYDCPHCKQNIEFELSGWIKTNEDERQWISLSFKEPYKKAESSTEDPF